MLKAYTKKMNVHICTMLCARSLPTTHHSGLAKHNKRGRYPPDKTSDGYLPPSLIPIVLCIDLSISICYQNHNIYKII